MPKAKLNDVELYYEDSRPGRSGAALSAIVVAERYLERWRGAVSLATLPHDHISIAAARDTAASRIDGYTIEQFAKDCAGIVGVFENPALSRRGVRSWRTNCPGIGDPAARSGGDPDDRRGRGGNQGDRRRAAGDSQHRRRRDPRPWL